MTYKNILPMANMLSGIETTETADPAYVNLFLGQREHFENLSGEHDATRNSAGKLRIGFAEDYTN